MAHTETLLPNVYLLHGEVGGRPLQLPLLVGTERAVLIDSGCASHPESLILPALAELGVSRDYLSLLINTHCDLDHQGGNAALKRALPHLRIACGEADRAAIESPQTIFAERYDAYRARHAHSYDDAAKAWIMEQLGDPQPVDMTFSGGERTSLGDGWDLEILHLPGHSRGHLGVWDKKHNVLFGGDAIHGAVYLDVHAAPALCPTYLDVQPYLQTIDKIESLPLDGYVGCHWKPARDPTAVQAFCEESRAFVHRAEAKVMAGIRSVGFAGINLTELCRIVGPSLGDWPDEANAELCYAFGGHLSDLTTRGLIHEHTSRVPVRYTSAT